MGNHFRADLQILRGISILLVLFYHLDIKYFENGFIGVDIFFVISGYLISKTYNSCEVGNFFKKRVSRLLPTYYSVIFVITIYSSLFCIYGDFYNVYIQILYSISFVSNFGYWLQNSYFNKTYFNPLLHFWSLSIEIQFYLLFPVLYKILCKNKRIPYILIFISIISCLIVTSVSPKTSFFLLPFRLWQFILGYLIEKNESSNIRAYSSRTSISALLILFLIIFIWPIDGNSTNIIVAHPGIPTILTTLCSYLIISSSMPLSIIKSRAGRILEKMGEYSYSIYLIHYPLILFNNYKPFNKGFINYNLINIIIVLIFIFILSYTSYKYIEKPYRVKSKGYKILILSPFLGIFAYLLLLTSFYFLDNPLKKIFYAQADRDTYRCGKLMRILDPFSSVCNIAKISHREPFPIFLVGNSHSDSIKKSFSEVAKDFYADVYFTVSNTPLMKDGQSASEIINLTLKYNSKNIVLHYSKDSLKIETLYELISLAEKNNIYIRLILPIPTFDVHVPQMMWSNMMHGEPLKKYTYENYLQDHKDFLDRIILIKSPVFSYYETAKNLCNPDCRLIDNNNNLVYFDDSHLTLSGSKLLTSTFITLMKDAKR